MNKSYLTTAVVSSIIFVGCATNTQTGILAGGALGAGTGALIDGGTGALVGGAIGVIGGALIGSALDAQERQAVEQNNPQTVRRIDNGQQLSVDDVIALSKSGVSDSKIIDLLEKTNSQFHLTAQDVMRMEKAGVSQRVINYMISS